MQNYLYMIAYLVVGFIFGYIAILQAKRERQSKNEAVNAFLTFLFVWPAVLFVGAIYILIRAIEFPVKKMVEKIYGEEYNA